MPCDTITTNSVNLEAADLAILMDALEEMGHQPQRVGNTIRFTIDGDQAVFASGEVTSRTASQAKLNTFSKTMTRAYSRSVVKAAAKKFGWTTETVKNDPFKLKIKRR